MRGLKRGGRGGKINVTFHSEFSLAAGRGRHGDGCPHLLIPTLHPHLKLSQLRCGTHIRPTKGQGDWVTAPLPWEGADCMPEAWG